MKIALDTNVLVYVSGVERHHADPAKAAALRRLLAQLEETCGFVVPVQVLGELFAVLRRVGRSSDAAYVQVMQWAARYPTPDSGRETMISALKLATEHRLQFWDAFILSAAAEAGCALLLSEDMQDGFVSRGVTVVNPLAEQPHPMLATLLAED